MIQIVTIQKCYIALQYVRKCFNLYTDMINITNYNGIKKLLITNYVVGTLDIEMKMEDHQSYTSNIY